jgi:3-deoxy-D-arabino-heptulosonate 7-phosphate (DAHP) synthase class II
MKGLELLRKVAFWGLDFVKGSPISKHYQDIRFILENFE